MSQNIVSLRVWGDFACFTRPEMKVERVSYPIMTPSAARGIFEAIFWEPQMYYLIDSIRVVKKGKWFSFRRNEVTSVISLDSVKTWMRNPNDVKAIQAGGGAADGTQRNMLALQDVEYIITSEIRLSDLGKKAGHVGAPLAAPFAGAKYLAEIERRAKNGKCFHRPHMGVREFSVDFDFVDDPEKAHEKRAQELGKGPLCIWSDEDLGLMLYDVFDYSQREGGFRWFSPAEMEIQENNRKAAIEKLPKTQRKQAEKEPLARFEGINIKPSAAFFHAVVKDSRLDCHPTRVKIQKSSFGE